jgi:nucleoside-diphosphate-sugar epimerase/predicted dehydrogenase
MTPPYPTPPAPPAIHVLGGGALVRDCYLPALRALGWCDRVHVYDPGPAPETIWRADFPGLDWQVSDFRTAFATLRPEDWVFVALPNWLHAEACFGALERGAHVLCEKPLTLDLASAERLVERAAELGRTLAVGMVRRYAPAFRALRQALAQAWVGPIESIDVQDGGVFAWPAVSGAFFDPRCGGVLADMGVHYLDLLEALVGPLECLAYRDDARGGLEAAAELELRSADGIPVRLRLSRLHPLANRLRVRARAGVFDMRKDDFAAVYFRPHGEPALEAALRPLPAFTSGPWRSEFGALFIEQFAAFARHLGGAAMPDVVPAARALGTVGLIEHCYRRRTPCRIEAGVDHPLEAAPILITGASGFIGGRLVEHLVDAGWNAIRAPLRRHQTAAGLARFAAVERPLLRFDRDEDLRTMVAGRRYVVHLAYGQEDGFDVTETGTARLIDAAIAAGVEAVVVTSTAWVYGNGRPGPIDEDAGPCPVAGAYAEGKLRMEQWIRARAQNSGSTRLVILNPSCVYGPLGKTYTQLPLELARRGEFCWIDGGQGVANLCHVDHLVDALLRALAVPSAHGRGYLISDGHTTWRAFLSALLGPLAATLPDYRAEQLIAMNRERNRPPTWRELGRAFLLDSPFNAALRRTRWFPVLRRWVQRRPETLGQIRRARRLAAVTDDRTPPPAWLIELFGPMQSIYVCRRAERELGWRPRSTLEQGIAATAAWLRDLEDDI